MSGQHGLTRLVTEDEMSRINSNIPALGGVHQLARNQQDLNLRLQRLSTGLRINRGADDPAGLIVSERLRAEIGTIRQAVENSQRASSVVSTAEGALNEASALLLDLQRLVVSTANEGGITQEEIAANQLQLDSILASLDRIAHTTTFAGRRLLDGELSYLTSGVPASVIPTIRLFGAHVPHGGSREVVVKVTQSAQTAQLGFVGTNATGTSTTSGTTLSLRGATGASLLTFASGTTLSEIKAAVNSVTEMTGVSAIVSTAGVSGVASALLLNSTAVGADAFVSVEPISGNFIELGNSNTTIRDTGQDVGVLIGGQPASARGLRVDVRSRMLDAELHLTRSFAQTLSSASFHITGGGALFQLTPQVNPNGQTFLGMNSVSSTNLGNAVTGLLHTLRSGGSNDLASLNFPTAQNIVEEAIDQISSQRGRLGNLQRNQIEPNINSQQVALENVMASESIIRDADMAVEVSALTRAQILVQTTQIALQFANAAPQQVLTLLGA